MPEKSILITGSSSGLGKACVRLFAERGWQVAATMRRPEREDELSHLANVQIIRLDVTDEAAVKAGVQETIDKLGRLDVLLNNAGRGLLGMFEAATREQIRQQFDVNLFGVMDVTRAVLPHFRRHGAGLIINVSSILGLVAMPFSSLYSSSKWALEGWTESLAYELQLLGIRVKLVSPGVIGTSFLDVADRAVDPSLSDYDRDAFRHVREKMMANRQATSSSHSSAEQIAEIVYGAATDDSNRFRYVAGEDANKLWADRQETGDQRFIEMIAKDFGFDD